MSEPFWTPLGAAAVDYIGVYDPAVQYAPGAVVSYQGVTYLAVNPSLGVTPPAAVLLGGSEIAYVESTVDTNVPVAAESSPLTIFDFGTITFDGSLIVIEFVSAIMLGGGSTSYLLVNLWDGNTDLGRFVYSGNNGAGAQRQAVSGQRRFSPTGSHNYRVRASAGNAAGTILGASPQLPAFARIRRSP